MDLTRFMPKFGADVDLTEEELDEQDKMAAKRRHEVGRLGPRRLGWLSNGQIRRQEERTNRAQARKANRRYRRNWLAAESELANLKAQVHVALGIIPATPDGQRNAHLALIRKFGVYDDQGVLVNDPIEVASQHLQSALFERQRIIDNQRRRQAAEAAK